MKKLIATMTLILMTMTLAVCPVYSQARQKCGVHVPFSFMVGDQTLPAGEYSFDPQLGWKSDMNVLVIRSADGSVYKAIVTSAASRSEVRQGGRVIFNRVGETYTLAQVWATDQPIGMQLRESRAQYELTQAGAARVEKVELVAQTLTSRGFQTASVAPTAR